MRVVRSAAGLETAVASARREAAAAFGDGTVFLERYLDAPRHIEVQIFGDTHGTWCTCSSGNARSSAATRRSSRRRRRPPWTRRCASELGEAAIAAGKAIGYTGAGTVEFVLDQANRFYFLEVNTRLQVEHPVTELVTGLDLVALQLQVAEGQPLPAEVRLATLTGHAIEARLYAEDVAAGFLPATGTLRAFDVPDLPGVRVDAGVAAGSAVGLHYDAMLAKVIAHGPTRDAARRRLARCLADAVLHGVTSNRDLLVGILREPEFQSGHIDTGYLTRHDPGRLARLAEPSHPPAGTRWPRRWPARPPAGLPPRCCAASRPAGATCPARTSTSRSTSAGSSSTSATGSPEPPLTATVNGEPVTGLALRQATPGRVIADIDGIRREITVRQSGGIWDVHSYLGSTELTELPRFPDPAPTAAPGSLLAPMPGTVARLEVAPGAHGQGRQPDRGAGGDEDGAQRVRAARRGGDRHRGDRRPAGGPGHRAGRGGHPGGGKVTGQPVSYERRGPAAWLTINRPEARNALNKAVRDGLWDGVRRFNADGDAKVLVLTGAGRPGVLRRRAISRRWPRGALQIPPPDFLPQFGRNIDVPKPTIAAVNGVAYAGGFALAQQCDLCLAAEHARFAITEVKVGRGAPWAAPLPWLIPPRVAMQILLTGDPVSRPAGARDRPGQRRRPGGGPGRQAAQQLAERIAANAPLSVLAAKRTVRLVAEHPLNAAFEAAEQIWAPVYRSEDAQEGPAAFRDKRPPAWKGR